MSVDWPLAAREGVLEECGAQLRRPGVDGIALSGPAGVGRTRLLDACATRAAEVGFDVRRATAHRSGREIPFAALAHVLPDRSLVDRGVPLLRQAAEALEASHDGRPVVLAIDDAHLLDPASALLAYQLAAEQAAFVLATVVDGADAPDPVTGLWRDGRVTRIDVGPFDRAATDAVLSAALDGAVGVGTVDALHHSSGGNAFVLRELVRGSLDEGTLARDGGLWRLTGDPRPSSRLREVVRAQVDALAADEREVLELLALGGPLPMEVVDEAGEVVEQLEDRGIVAAMQTGPGAVTVSLAHPAHGDVLLAELSELRARRLRRVLADRIEASAGAGHDLALRLAILRMDSDGRAPVELLLEAGRQAFFAHDEVVAERLAAHAQAIAPSFAGAHLQREALYRLGRPLEASAIEEPDGADEERTSVAHHRAVRLFWMDGDRSAAVAVLDEAMAGLDGPWRAELQATAATIAVNAGDPLGALAHIAQVDDDSARSLLQANLASGLALPHLGRGEEALAVIDAGQRTYAAAGDVPSTYQPSLLEVCEVTALLAIGELDRSEAAAERTSRAARAIGDRAGEAFAALTLGRTLFEQGKTRGSLRWMREAAAAFSAIGHHGPLRWSLGGVALAAATLGDHPAAVLALEQVRDLGAHDARMLEADIDRGRAWTALAGGDPEGAREILRTAVLDTRDRALVALEAQLLHDLARLDRAVEVVERLDELRQRAEGRWIPALADDARAIGTAQADALVESAERLDGLGASLIAAETAARAAAAFARAGRQRDAASWRLTASEWAAVSEGAATPALAQGEGPVPLTAREREIAVLAGSGMTSKAIAERLFLSARTIDNNLARVYVKLGISDRGALAQALDSTTPNLS